jgi:hypothetical protein
MASVILRRKRHCFQLSITSSVLLGKSYDFAGIFARTGTPLLAVTSNLPVLIFLGGIIRVLIFYRLASFESIKRKIL